MACQLAGGHCKAKNESASVHGGLQFSFAVAVAVATPVQYQVLAGFNYATVVIVKQFGIMSRHPNKKHTRYAHIGPLLFARRWPPHSSQHVHKHVPATRARTTHIHTYANKKQSCARACCAHPETHCTLHIWSCKPKLTNLLSSYCHFHACPLHNAHTGQSHPRSHLRTHQVQ